MRDICQLFPWLDPTTNNEGSSLVKSFELSRYFRAKNELKKIQAHFAFCVRARVISYGVRLHMSGKNLSNLLKNWAENFAKPEKHFGLQSSHFFIFRMCKRAF